MARLTSDILFTGSLGSISAYKMRGSDQIILRRKDGPNPHHIKTSPSFDLVRRNNAEFSGRAAASRWIMNMLWPQKALADYNIAGPLNALVKPIQELDTQSIFGQRHVRLSQNKDLLQGFSLNRKNSFDSVIRNAVPHTPREQPEQQRLKCRSFCRGSTSFHERMLRFIAYNWY